MSKLPIKVLYVDDYRLDRELVRDALEEEPGEFQVAEAANRAEFEALLVSGPWDLVLTDYFIGDFRGIEVIERVRSQHPGVPVVMLTGTGSEEVAVEALKRGAADYVLKKPQHIQRLPYTLRSVLERKRAETALRESDERLRLALEASGQGLWDLDTLAGTVVAAPELMRLLGFEAEEQATSYNVWQSRAHPDDIQDFAARMQACLAGEERFFESEPRVRCSTGEWRWLYVRGRVVEYDAEGRPARVMGTCSDITQRKLSEQALREAEERLRQSQKMEAIGQLAGGIAHDFNNILTTILGYSAIILANEESNPGSTIADMEEIRAAAERASILTRQILAFSRRQPLARETVSLNDIVAHTEHLIRHTLEEDIDVVVCLAPTLGLVEADPPQLEQVIVNMAVNARDAMPAGGRLTIETQDVELSQDYCRAHQEVSPGPYVMLVVSDTGAGMSEETMARIFEPFFTTKEPSRGTGLGLASAYGIITQSGGSISVSSELGKGSVFKVYLPRVDKPVETRPVPAASSQSSGGPETILVVEDEESVRVLVRRILGGLGYSLLVADNGQDALALLEGDQRVDLLLSDVVLRGAMRGDALAEAALRLHPDLPVLLMSGYLGEWTLDGKRLELGINFLAKPFEPDELAKLVRESLDAKPTPALSAQRRKTSR